MLVVFNWMADTANSTLLDAGYSGANKHSWVLYWDIFKLLLKSLIFSGFFPPFFIIYLFIFTLQYRIGFVGQDFPSGSVIKKTHLPMQKTQVWSLGQEDPLEEKMASYSSILTGKEKLSRLHSMGSQRVGRNWACACAYTYIHTHTHTAFSLICITNAKLFLVLCHRPCDW